MSCQTKKMATSGRIRDPSTRGSPRKSPLQVQARPRSKRGCCEEESPQRRKRTPSSRSRQHGNSPSRQGEEFLFWKPEPARHSRMTPPSKIPVPSRAQRPSRPKMGVPIMTSTPRHLFAASSSPGKKKVEEVETTQVVEEPIYCEIGDSAEKARSGDAGGQQRLLYPSSSTSLTRTDCEKRGGAPIVGSSGLHHRQSLADFSHKMSSTRLRASPSAQAAPDRSNGGLLGRRAATQFDFFGDGHQPSPPPTHHAHVATTVLSEYRHGLPPKSVYNHMSGIPYSQPPQRKFIPGLHGINGYCSDNDFSSLANESIASSSLPGQTLRSGDLSEVNVHPGSTLKKGLLWQQRDKLFSRWKERFFILTKDYLQCFRRGSSRISEMGAFIFRIKLIEVEEVELIDKRGYLTISLSMGKEGKVLLRKPDGIRDWFNVLKECVSTCKERRGMMKTSKEFWSKKQFTDSSSMEQYIMARQRIGRQYGYCMESTQSSFPFDSAALPTHLRMKMKGSLNPLSSNQQHNVSTNNLKHYGYIDVPRSSNSTYGNSEGDDKGQLQSLCTDLYLGGNVRDYPSEYSHDSGVDSMNTNSSGSVMSGSITSPMMNRPSKFVFKSPDEDPLTHLKSNSERDRKISLV